MPTFDKQDIQPLALQALKDLGLELDDFQDRKAFTSFPLRVMQFGGIKFQDGPVGRVVSPPELDPRELIVMGSAGGVPKGTRTSGHQVNLFSLGGMLVATAVANPQSFPYVGLMLSLLAACTATLTPQQAALFLAIKKLDDDGNTIPTAVAVAAAMGAFLKSPNYSVFKLLDIVDELTALGVDVWTENPPNLIVRHKEATIFIPGM